MSLNRTTVLKAVDATAGALICRLAGWLDYARDGRPADGVPEPRQVRRLLVIRPGGMGDMILLLPCIRRLRERYPDAVIDLACERRNADVLKLAGMESNALLYDVHPFRFLRQLAGRTYDIAIDTEQFHHFSAVFARWSGARIRIGFKINPWRNPLYTHLVNYAPDGPEGIQFGRLLQPLGIPDAGDSPTDLFPTLPPRLPPDMEQSLRATAPDGRYAVIHPFSSTPYKQWSHRKFVDTAAALHAEQGLIPVLVGAENDAARSEIPAALKQAGVPVVSLPGGSDLSVAALLIKGAGLFLGGDSGLAHLAVALGTPTVVLFGPSDHLKWGKDDARHAVVRTLLPCSPCFIFGYHKPCKTLACMDGISAGAVLEACRRVLRESGSAASRPR